MFIQDVPKPYRLPGEAVPLWIAIGMSLLGALGSLAASWLVLTTAPWEPAWSPWRVETHHERDTQSTPSAPTPVAPEPPSRASHDMTGMGDTAAGQVPPVAQAVEGHTPPPQPDESRVVQKTALQATHEPSEPIGRLAASRPAAELAAGGTPAPTTSIETPSDGEGSEQAEDETTEPERAEGPRASKPRDCPPLFTLNFTRGSSRPRTPELEARIARLREWLDAHPSATLLVEGHTDSRGLEESNLLLSYRRATAVALLLTTAGIPQQRLETRAYGEYHLLAGLPPESEKNRRVTLRVDGTEDCPETATQDNIP